MPINKKDIKVSPNNPCPFLRASVQQGFLDNTIDSIGDVAKTVKKVTKAGNEQAKTPALALRAVALIANGLGPVSILTSAFRGVRLNQLRGGPLDKKGVGSQILDVKGVVNEAQLERLATFASDKTCADGTVELGLNAAEIEVFMDDNFARALGHRRKIDRKLMNGEWPVLLDFMGKEGNDGRYLSVSEVRTLFLDRDFPERIMSKL